MHKKIGIIIASFILVIALAPAHAATGAADSPPSAAAQQAGSETVSAIVERAESLMENKDFAAAEALLHQALKANPDNPDVVGEMGMLRLKQDNHAQAYEYFSRALQLTNGESGRWRSLVKVAKFWWLLREARNARAAKDYTLAENKLNEAIKLDPGVADPYAILAGVQDDRGKTSAATATYRQALSINPLNSEALEGLVAINRRQGMTQAQRFVAQLTPAQRNVLSQTIASMNAAMVEAQMSDQDEFLSALTRIPVDKRPAYISGMWGNKLEQLVGSHANAGRRNEAVSLLKEAEKLAANDEEASLAVAASWGRVGEYRQADRMFDKLKALHTPPSIRWRLRHAGYLAMKDSPELRAELDAIAAMPALSSEDAQALHTLQESLALRTAYRQIDSGSPGQAHQTLAPFLKAAPNRVTLLLAEARAFQAEKQWQSALSAYAQILLIDPGDSDAIRGQIETKLASGDRDAALAQLDEWAASGILDNPYNGLKMAGLYLLLDEPERAHQLFDTLLEKFPNHPIVLYEAAQLAHREGRLEDEIVYLKMSVAADRAERAPAGAQPLVSSGPAAYRQIGFDELDSPNKIQRDWKERRLAVLIDRRTGWFSSAVDVHSRSGTPGQMQLNSVEIPLEYKAPWHMDDEVFFRADMVRLNAGEIDSASDRFGSMQFCQPLCAAAPLDQSAHGMSFNAGYQRGDFSADIGSTPLNFPVSNTVGGIRQQGSFDSFGYSLEVSRRPLTDSLLSFAGSRDPNTGKVWGGVVASGARLGISVDQGGDFGFWSTLGWHSLTGRNVQANKRTQVLAGEQWRVINEDNRKLIIGVSGMYWRFAEDAGEYTFGHGGYYSPHSYRSWSLPITYTERLSRLSYMLSGSVSRSRAQMLDAPLYPTDSSLQVLGGDPVYVGAPSKSRGHSLTAALEYQISQQLFAGGLYSIDRAESYSPNRAVVYLRYSLDQPGAQPVFMPPLPVEPSSQLK